MTGWTKTTLAGVEQELASRNPGARVVLVAALGIAALLVSATGAVASNEITPPPVPANLEVPAGNRAVSMMHAVGTQNYLCLGSGSPWTFIGQPQATLFDDEAEQTITHYLSINPIDGQARATWQHSKDTSAVWARAIESSLDANYVAPGAIPWLLLRVVGSQEGPTGGDRLPATTYTQRVNTVGGTAPAGGCPAPGARAFAPYETDYVFYKSR